MDAHKKIFKKKKLRLIQTVSKAKAHGSKKYIKKMQNVHRWPHGPNVMATSGQTVLNILTEGDGRLDFLKHLCNTAIKYS